MPHRYARAFWTQLRGYPVALIFLWLATVGATTILTAPPAGASSTGSWTVSAPPSVAETPNELSGVSCVSSSFCVGVGSAGSNTSAGQVSTVESPLVESWNGSTWSVMSTPPTTSPYGLNAVDCVSTTFCMAVGNPDGTDSGSVLTELWNGSAWSIVAAPGVGPPVNTDFTSVSCASTRFCAAVGSWGDGVPGESVMDIWNGTAWRLASPTAGVSNNLVASLQGVSCTSSTFCLGVGDAYATYPAQGGLVYVASVVMWNGSNWSVAPGGGPNQSLFGVSCVSSTSCVAVGSGNFYLSSSVIADWNGTSWSEVTPPSQGSTYSLSNISCQGANCVAVGESNDSNTSSTSTYEPVVVTDSGGYWSFGAAPEVPSVPGGLLGGVSCVPGTCLAVGETYGATSPEYQTLAMMGPFASSASHLNKPVVGMAATPDGKGYWLVASDGGIFTYGDAGFYGSTGALRLNAPIVGMAATPDGKGYWLVASDGGIFTYGDAGFDGSAGNIKLNKPIVGMAATPDGKGYWLVASDGGIFTYGDAGFDGSAGALPLNKPIVGMAATADGEGYWLVASDGGIFTYGDAGFDGSTGALQLNDPIVGMAATPDAKGYWLVASDGGIFTYGDAGFYGSTGDIQLNDPIVGMATTANGAGYWFGASDGGVFTFGDAGFYGSAGD